MGWSSSQKKEIRSDEAKRLSGIRDLDVTGSEEYLERRRQKVRDLRDPVKALSKPSTLTEVLRSLIGGGDKKLDEADLIDLENIEKAQLIDRVKKKRKLSSQIEGMEKD
jgi:hypothetical protein